MKNPFVYFILIICSMMNATESLSAIYSNNTATSFSGGQALDLGGGYVLPNLPSGKEYTAASFGADIGGGFSCSGFDWAAQLRSELMLDLSQKDIKALGTAALAGSAKYLMASLFPTLFSTVENALKNAKAMLRIAKADCNSIYEALSAKDPLGTMRDKAAGEAAGQAAKDGGTWNQAMENFFKKSYHFDAKNDVVKKLSDDPYTQALISSVLGNVKIDIGGDGAGGRIEGDSQKPELIADAPHGVTYNVLYSVITKRLDGQTPCDAEFTISEKERTDILKSLRGNQPKNLKDVNNKIDGIAFLALDKINSMHAVYAPLTCSAIERYRQVRMSPSERSLIAHIVATELSIDGMRRALAELWILMTGMNLKAGPEGEMMQAIADRRLQLIADRLDAIERNSAKSSDIMRQVLKNRDERMAFIQDSKIQSQRRRAMQINAPTGVYMQSPLY